MRRLLKLIVLGGAGYALWRLLTAGDPEPAIPADAEAPVPAPVRTSSADAGSSSATKAELYERAKALGIEGRSKLSKSELERAIRRAG